jgi:16S rRNA (cytosine1402-N4)-methyltransferase
VPTLRAIGGAMKADSAELAGNPRARSAVLRVAEKLGSPVHAGEPRP